MHDELMSNSMSIIAPTQRMTHDSKLDFCKCVCVCMCVFERARERGTEILWNVKLIQIICCLISELGSGGVRVEMIEGNIITLFPKTCPNAASATPFLSLN